MKFTHVYRFVCCLATATSVARMLAHPPRRGRQRIVHNYRKECVFSSTFSLKLQETRDIHVQRTTVFAWRDGQLFADTCCTTSAEDVIFKLVPEVAHRGQHRVGSGLAQTAQRAVANIACQFI